MREIVNMVESAYMEEGMGRVSSAERAQLRSPQTRTFMNSSAALMPGLKISGVSSYTGGNKGLPLAQKAILLYSTEDGRLLSVLEAGWISWMRTGATSGVATRYLAPQKATVAGIFGSGVQARSQLMAIAAVRDLEVAYVYSPREERRQEFAAEMSLKLDLPVTAVDDAEEILAEAQIICTATTSRTPVFDGAKVREGTHVNAIGQHYPDRREVDSVLLSRSRVVVDLEERAIQEDGELLIPMQKGDWDVAQLDSSLGAIVAGLKPGRIANEITLFTSGGIASEMLAVAAGVYLVAEDEDLGQEIDWHIDADAWRQAGLVGSRKE